MKNILIRLVQFKQYLLSIGPTRDFCIYENKHRPTKVIKTFQVENGSLMIMQPGSQKHTKHKIQKQSECSNVVRYSISFRRVHTTTDNVSTSGNPGETPHNSVSDPPVTLIIGTSIADDLDTKRLAGKNNSAKVVKLCKRGGHIQHISNTVDEYFKSDQCNSSAVHKIIVSMGTNDIRWCKSGVGHLYYPMQNFICRLKTFFPNAKIFIQSLTPVRYHRTRPENASVVENVLEFNKILLKVAVAEECWYFDMMDKFLDNTPFRIPVPGLFRDSVHLSPSGLSILAKAFIKIIRGRKSPIIDI